MKIFLDTNILLDFLDNKRLRHNLVNNFFEKVIFNKEELVVSDDILTTIYYVAKKNITRKKLLSFLGMLLDKSSIINFDKSMVKQALQLCQKNSHLDFEDVLQSVCAGENDCDIIVTSDKKFPKVKIPVKTVKEFLEEYEE